MTTAIQKKTELGVMNFARGNVIPMRFTDSQIQRDFEAQVELHKKLYGGCEHLFSMMITPNRDKSGKIVSYTSIARDKKHQLDDPDLNGINKEYAYQMTKERLHPTASAAMRGEARDMTADEVRLLAMQGGNDLGIDPSERYSGFDK